MLHHIIILYISLYSAIRVVAVRPCGGPCTEEREKEGERKSNRERVRDKDRQRALATHNTTFEALLYPNFIRRGVLQQVG